MKYVIALLFILLSFKSPAYELAKNIDLSNVPGASVIKVSENKFVLLEYNFFRQPLISIGSAVLNSKCQVNKILCSKLLIGSKTNSLFLKLNTSNRPTVHTIRYELDGLSKEIQLQILPDDFPIYKVDGKSLLQDDLVFSLFPLKGEKSSWVSFLLVLDHNGNVLFTRKLQGIAADFKRHKISNETFYSYLDVEQSFERVTMVGQRILLNSNFEIIKKLPEKQDLHEFLLQDLNSYIYFTYGLSRSVVGTYYIDQKIEQVRDGKKVFSFGIDDLILQKYYASNVLKMMFQDQLAIHQYHLNSLQVVDDNRWLVSLGFDSVFMLNPKTKKIEWVFGGVNDQFGITNEMAMNLHHTPFFDSQDDTLTVFDNGFTTRRSRVLSFHLDFKNKKIKKFVPLHDQGFFTLMMGGVEKKSDIYSISFGSKDIGSYDFIEQKEATKTMGLSFTSPGYGIYRIYRSK